MEEKKENHTKRKHKTKSLLCFSLARRGQPSSLVLVLASQCHDKDGEVEKAFGRNAQQSKDEAPGLVETGETLRPGHWESVSKMVSDLIFYIPAQDALLLFLIGLTDIFLSRNQNVSNHLRQSICSQCPHSCSTDAALFKNSFISRDTMQQRGKHLSS